MSSPRKGLNLARAIMLLSILGAIALGWFGWQRQQRVNEMQANLELPVKRVAGDIVRLAQQHTVLSRENSRFGLEAQGDPETYIRRIASAQFVEIGDVDLTTRNVPSARGIQDTTLQIKPNPPRAFQRSQIANFLYKLEADSRRIVVTDLEIDKADKRLKPHELPEDRWMFQATVTSRQAVEDK